MTNPDGPVRVLHVLQRMEAGGTQALLMNLYRNIDRSRLQFDFLVEYRERQFYDDEIESLGGRIYRASFREDLNPFRFYSYLRRFFEEHREYRIVHVHAYTIGYLPLRAARRAGVVVRVAHSHNNRMSGHAVAVKKVMRALFPLNANRFMACSEEAGRFLFGDRGFTVVPNAIDAASFAYDPAARAEARAELGFSDDEFVVGSVGRLHHQKNQGFLLEVFAEILKARPGARLLLVGDGPERDALIGRARELGIEGDLVLLSNRHDMPRLYQAMDVFVLTSLYEGLGIVTVEAQASGLPTFVSEGVAAEAEVSPLFRRLDLADGPAAWAQAVLSEPAAARVSRVDDVRAHGFDVKENAERLQDWYLRETADSFISE